MDASQIHLIINHFPIIGLIIGFFVLVAGYGLHEIIIKRVALGILVFASLMSIPTYISGENAEDIVEDAIVVSHDVIEEHEEAAGIFIWVISFIGILAATTLALDLKEIAVAKMLYHATLVLSFLAMISAFTTGATGGEIYHNQNSGQTINNTSNNSDHDD